MKLLRSTLIPFLLATSASALSPVPQLAGSGRWNSKEYEVRVGDIAHVKAGAFDPEKSDAPFSQKRALSLARPALRKLVGDAERLFSVESVRLCPDWASRGRYWFYVVELSSDHESLVTKEEGRIYPVSLPFIVYFDGFVEIPFAPKA